MTLEFFVKPSNYNLYQTLNFNPERQLPKPKSLFVKPDHEQTETCQKIPNQISSEFFHCTKKIFTLTLQLTDKMIEENTLRRFLLANANLQKDLEFNAFKEKTTIKLNKQSNNLRELFFSNFVSHLSYNCKSAHTIFCTNTDI